MHISLISDIFHINCEEKKFVGKWSTIYDFLYNSDQSTNIDPVYIDLIGERTGKVATFYHSTSPVNCSKYLLTTRSREMIPWLEDWVLIIKKKE